MIDCFDLLSVQGTLKGLLQHHSLKASILCLSVFFMVQLSHSYTTTGKTIALTAAAAKSLQSCPTLCSISLQPGVLGFIKTILKKVITQTTTDRTWKDIIRQRVVFCRVDLKWRSKRLDVSYSVMFHSLWLHGLSPKLMLSNCGAEEDSWESLGLQEDPTSPFWRRSALGFLWKEWC